MKYRMCALAVFAVLMLSLPVAIFAQSGGKLVTLFSDTFNRSAIGADWTIVEDPDPSEKSNWYLQDKKLVQYSNIYRTGSWEMYYQGTHIVAGSPSWTDYSLSATVVPTDNDGWGAIIRYKDKNTYYRFIAVPDPANNGPFMRIDKTIGGVPKILVSRSDFPEPGKPHEVKFEAFGDRLAVTIDGKLVLEARDKDIGSGKIGFMTYACSAEFSNVVVTGIQPVAAVPSPAPSPAPGTAPKPVMTPASPAKASPSGYYSSATGAYRFPLPKGWTVVDSDPEAGMDTLADPAEPSLFMVFDSHGVDVGDLDSKATIELMTNALKESNPDAATATLLVGKKVAVRSAYFDVAQGMMAWTYLIPHAKRAYQISILTAADALLTVQPDAVRKIMASIEWAP